MTKAPATMTLGWLIDELSSMAAKHGLETPVYIHDADTDWSLPLADDAVRFGKDKFGDGVEGAIMLKSDGYHG